MRTGGRVSSGLRNCSGVVCFYLLLMVSMVFG